MLACLIEALGSIPSNSRKDNNKTHKSTTKAENSFFFLSKDDGPWVSVLTYSLSHFC